MKNIFIFQHTCEITIAASVEILVTSTQLKCLVLFQMTAQHALILGLFVLFVITVSSWRNDDQEIFEINKRGEEEQERGNGIGIGGWKRKKRSVGEYLLVSCIGFDRISNLTNRFLKQKNCSDEGRSKRRWFIFHGVQQTNINFQLIQSKVLLVTQINTSSYTD